MKMFRIFVTLVCLPTNLVEITADAETLKLSTSSQNLTNCTASLASRYWMKYARAGGSWRTSLVVLDNFDFRFQDSWFPPPRSIESEFCLSEINCSSGGVLGLTKSSFLGYFKLFKLTDLGRMDRFSEFKALVNFLKIDILIFDWSLIPTLHPLLIQLSLFLLQFGHKLSQLLTLFLLFIF